MVLAMFTIVVGNGVPIQKFQDFFHLSKGQIIDFSKIKKHRRIIFRNFYCTYSIIRYNLYLPKLDLNKLMSSLTS